MHLTNRSYTKTYTVYVEMEIIEIVVIVENLRRDDLETMSFILSYKP